MDLGLGMGSRSARVPVRRPPEGQTSFPTFESEEGGACKLKGKKKLLNFSPNTVVEAGPGGRRLHGDSRPVRVRRLGLARDARGREEWAWGRGAARPARGMGSRGERVNFKSGA